MIGNKPIDPRCLCICAQASAQDAKTLLDAMATTQAGLPEPQGLALALAKARRHDLLAVVGEQYPGFDGVDLEDLAVSLAVSVGDGAFSALDPQTEQAIGEQVIATGVICLDDLLGLRDLAVANPGGPVNASNRRWILGRPFNAALAMGLLKGAIAMGVDQQDPRWKGLLNLVAQQALRRSVDTHNRESATLDVLIDFTLSRIKIIDGSDPFAETAIAVLNFHSLGSKDEGRWPKARAACANVVGEKEFCVAFASRALQVRRWARTCPDGGVIDPEIFKTAGSMPDAMGALVAYGARSSDERLLDRVCEDLGTLAWDEAERMAFTRSMIKEMNWTRRYWSKDPRNLHGDPTRLARVLEAVHGLGPAVEDMALAIIRKLNTTDVDVRGGVDGFIEQLRVALSNAQMQEGTAVAPELKSAGPRI